MCFLAASFNTERNLVLDVRDKLTRKGLSLLGAALIEYRKEGGFIDQRFLQLSNIPLSLSLLLADGFGSYFTVKINHKKTFLPSYYQSGYFTSILTDILRFPSSDLLLFKPIAAPPWLSFTPLLPSSSTPQSIPSSFSPVLSSFSIINLFLR